MGLFNSLIGNEINSLAKGAITGGISDLSNTFAQITGQAVESFFGTDYIKDYAHAAELMRPNGLALAPKHKFLFHVFFTLQYPDKFGPSDNGLIGALVKSVQLPSFSIDTQEYVQYNRKRLVHNKIKYEPVTVKFHDDSSDVIRSLWADYYKYYFADAMYDYSPANGNQTVDGKANYNERDVYKPTINNQQFGWGKTVISPDGEEKLPFFKDIVIYGMSRGTYQAYTLINPVITSWRHDTYDYSVGNGVMEHDVQLQYEAVKYTSGKIAKSDSSSRQSDLNVKGFAVTGRYDKVPGGLKPGSTTSVFGQGGITDSIASVEKDLASGNWLGAIRTVGASAKTFGSIENLTKVITSDVKDVVTDAAITGLGNVVRNITFPTIGGDTTGKSNPATPKSE
jgi:hypothetical protein